MDEVMNSYPEMFHRLIEIKISIKKKGRKGGNKFLINKENHLAY